MKSGYIPYWFNVKITNDEKNTGQNIFHVGSIKILNL